MNSRIPRKTWRARRGWWSLPLLLAAGIGCQPDGPARVPLEGRVLYKGEAIADGDIAFLPQGSNAGAPITAVIQDGKYSIAAQDGPIPGAYRVEIEGFRKTGRQIPDMVTPLAPGEPRGVIEEKQPFVPPKYNHDSTLTAEIKTETKELNFDLKP